MDAPVATKEAENQRRWKTAIKDEAFDSVRPQIIVGTRAEELPSVVEEDLIFPGELKPGAGFENFRFAASFLTRNRPSLTQTKTGFSPVP